MHCEPNKQDNGCSSRKLPIDDTSNDLSYQTSDELMKSALNSTVLVDALETIPALKKKCARLGINGNFGYQRTARGEVNRCGLYEVERILDHDAVNHLYLIKWKGYGTEFNTWEPIDHLGNITGLVCDFRLVERSLSDDNKVAYKKLILLGSLVEELISPANEDPYVLLKLTGNSASTHKPADLIFLKGELKSKSKCLREALIGDERFQSDYVSILENTIKDLRIVVAFDSLDKLEKAVSDRKKFFKCLKIREANINRLISKEEGCATIEIENNCDDDLSAEDFTYITKCKAGSPDITISQKPRWFCVCAKYCNSNAQKCCPTKNKSHGSYYKNGSLKNLKQTTIFECNSKCNCPSTCPNRVIQKGRKFKLGIFKTHDGRGWGIKALERIPKGRFIVEYVGEIITVEEAERRLALKENSHLTYLFDLSYEIGTSCNYVVDGEKFGNMSRFINHSCTPNMEVFMFWVDNTDKKMPRVAFFSRKNIASGEELTFDYRMSGPGTFHTSESDTSVIKVPCKCNSANCRKILF
ncbi:hypothetical protein HA402_004996 [Bradysia odoriphaga]|nr:hypothetical protein HA402_004996 [Bradysia odoriphaga]